MKWRLYIWIVPVLLLIVLTACSSERKKYMNLAKKGGISEKDSAAMYFYRNGDYERASFLFEELTGAYRGGARAKDILYYYAYSKYHTNLFIVAAYYFEQYSHLYPNDPRTEDCTYLVGLCYSQESDPYYLDQKFTVKAIDQFQFFMDNYPFSNHVNDINKRMTRLRERLAKKEYESAYQYYKIQNYKAGVTAFEVMIQEYPDSRFRETAQFMQFKCAVLLSDHSIVHKKRFRYGEALDLYKSFVDKFPNSEYLKEAENLYVRARRTKGKIDAEEEDREQRRAERVANSSE